MSELSRKSEFNLDAADLLYKNHYYASACHPIYYSCLQLISHKLIKCDVTLEQQAALSSSQYHGNSHFCLIKESSNRIQAGGYREKKEYEDNIRQLKDLRERADYKEDEIKPEECCQALATAKLVIQKIKTIKEYGRNIKRN